MPITTAREVNGQEQPVGTAVNDHGVLVTSFTAHQPRTFALRLGPPPTKVAAVRSVPLALRYNLATATNDGTRSQAGL